jgi:hypothetical protein
LVYPFHQVLMKPCYHPFLEMCTHLIDCLVPHVPHAVETIQDQGVDVCHFLLPYCRAHNLELVGLVVLGLEEVVEMMEHLFALML